MIKQNDQLVLFAITLKRGHCARLFFSTGVRDLFSFDELLCRSFFLPTSTLFFCSRPIHFLQMSRYKDTKFLAVDFMSSQIAPSTKVDKTCLKFYTENSWCGVGMHQIKILYNGKNLHTLCISSKLRFFL
jgi:hypothetical protein